VHRYEELEKEYYKKQKLKIFFSLIIVVVLIIGGYYFYKKISVKKLPSFVNKNKKEIKTYEKNETKANPKPKEKIKKTEVKKIKKESQKNDRLIFVIPNIDENEIKEEKFEKKEVKEEKKIKKTKKEIKNKPKSPPPVKPNPQLIIKEKPVSLTELKQKFSQKPSYDLAMMIARTYYNQKKYKQAQIWVIKANNLSPQKVESWLLFADILLKENKKQKAKEILGIYLDQYGENPDIKAKIRSIDE